MPDGFAQPLPAPDRSRPQAPAYAHIGSPALMALWLAAETMRQGVMRRCTAWAQQLQEACDAFGRHPLPELRGSSTDMVSVTHAMALGLELPYMPELFETNRPSAPTLGTAAPPRTPVECVPEALWASYQQLDPIDAAACGQDALCTLTLEPLHVLTQPVAACHNTVVQVYEYSALQHFWQVYPDRKITTPSYMPIGALRRVVGARHVSASDQ